MTNSDKRATMTTPETQPAAPKPEAAKLGDLQFSLRSSQPTVVNDGCGGPLCLVRFCHAALGRFGQLCVVEHRISFLALACRPHRLGLSRYSLCGPYAAVRRHRLMCHPADVVSYVAAAYCPLRNLHGYLRGGVSPLGSPGRCSLRRHDLCQGTWQKRAFAPTSRDPHPQSDPPPAGSISGPRIE